MTQRLRDIPSIPPNTPEELARPLRAMREILQRLVGTRGDELDAALTRRSGSVVGGGGTVIIGGGSGSGGAYTPDLTPPPTPSDLTIQAGFSEVIISWSGINYTQGNGNKQTLIYAVKKDPSDPSMPVFGDAPLVAVAPHALTVIALSSELNTRWHVWAKFETNDGVLSVGPAGGTNGVQGTTGQDIGQLLGLLDGRITRSQLYLDLAIPIDRIGSNADEAAADALSVALRTYQEIQERNAALLAEAQDRGTAISETRSQLQAADSALASVVTTLTATVQGNLTVALAAVQTEATARAGADSAEATERSNLAVQLRGSYTGTDLEAVTTGLIAAERVARADADETTAAAVEALEVQVFTPSTGLLARATALESVTTNVISGNVALANRASALEATVNNGITGVVATAAALDVVETLVNNGTSGNVALAGRASTLEVSMFSPTTGNNPTYAALATEATVRAGETGDLFAQMTVKIDLNGWVTGYGLASTVIDGAPSSAFLVRSDQFAVKPPTNYTGPTAPPTPSLNQRWYDTVNMVVKRWTGSAWEVFNDLAFVVQASPTTEGGVAIPAGVYMDAAYILRLDAQYGRFQTLVADDIAAADIQVAQLVAGTLRVGSYIQSQGFVANTSGWRISAAGNIEANDAVLRGVIYASGGLIGGITIVSNALQSSNFVAGTSGWRIRSDGSAEFDAATIRGQLTTSQLVLGAVSSNVTTPVQDSVSYTTWANSAAAATIDLTPLASIAMTTGWLRAIAKARIKAIVTSASVAAVLFEVSLREVTSGGSLIDTLEIDTALVPVAHGGTFTQAGATEERSAMWSPSLYFRDNNNAGTRYFQVRVVVRALNTSGVTVAPGGLVSSPGGSVPARIEVRGEVDLDERKV